MKKILDKIKALPDISIKDALRKIDAAGLAALFICSKDNTLLGVVTDGDIRRKILKNNNLNESIAVCYKRNPLCVEEENYTVDQVKKLMLEHYIKVVPVVNKKKKLVNILNWTDIFSGDPVIHSQMNIPVVIMAGGRGERMGPFTHIFPKPLIPVGDKPILQIIIERFIEHGASQFYITLNYKGEMIKMYFDHLKKDFGIKYIWEKEYLGTAGSLKLLPKNISNVFIVSNSDIIVKADYWDLLKSHEENGNILTIVGSIQHHKVPYGVIDYEEGQVKSIEEKPEYDLTVNTGVYILSKEVLKYIPKNKYFDMTDLIQALLDQKKKVGVYPVSENSYMDTGQWEKYRESREKLEILR